MHTEHILALMNNKKIKVKKGEIWTCKLEGAKGCEQSGVRPVVIIQNDKGNTFSPTTIVASITSQHKGKHIPTHAKLTNPKLKHDSVIMLEQVRTVDKTSLGIKIGELTKKQFKQLNKCIRISFNV